MPVFAVDRNPGIIDWFNAAFKDADMKVKTM
jgi:hypothetical protein